MQIKKYVASTLKEASQKMKSELGSEAIVLGTRIIENDPRYGGKKMFELTAGMDDNFVPPAASLPSEEPRQTAAPRTFADELASMSDKIFTQPKPSRQASSGPELLNIDFSSVRKKEERGQRLPEIPGLTDNTQLSSGRGGRIEQALREVEETLHQREIQESTVQLIINQLRKYSDFLQPSNIDNYVKSTISSMIPVSKFEVQKKNRSKLIALVGPTGVGKTTCIAKLAVISKILHNLNIGLISFDTFRLGAIDQLKIFAEISQIDLRVAYETSDVPGYINEFKKKDIVFIDTAGRSQNNTELLKDTKKFLTPLNVDEIYLALSTTSTTRNMLDVAEKFRVLNYNGIVFTKLDEAVSFGNILNVASTVNIPIKYLTNGQVIPDDIIAADSEFIANMIYTGNISK